MLSGHLQEKNGRYHMVINYKNEQGNWTQKWKSTKLPVKGNKKKAQTILDEECRRMKKVFGGNQVRIDSTVLFADYIEEWLLQSRTRLAPSTFLGYHRVITKSISPYFRKQKVTLVNICPKHINEYYNYLRQEMGLGENTIRRHHANIRKCLQKAFVNELILSNPADKVEKEEITPFLADHYSLAELSELFEVIKGHWMETIILIASFYGLRRSEVLGLRWSSISFIEETLTVRHSVTTGMNDGNEVTIISRENLKNKSSFRTLPLDKSIADTLKKQRKQQKLYQKVCGNAYNPDVEDYVFVDELGYLLSPERVTKNFQRLLKKHELRHIRFHDLRHSCASLQLNNGVSLKAIQLWLGHSSFSTTANIYAHLDTKEKDNQSKLLSSLLLGGEE